MKTAKIFKAMEKLVDQYVTHWKNDLDIDKATIKKNKTETVFYWYLRECGTQLISAKDMKYIESGVPAEAEFWLDQAKAIYKIDLENQELKILAPGYMKNLISQAKPMSEAVKLEYVIDRMNTLKIQESDRAWEVLYSVARAMKVKHWKIDWLIDNYANFKEILAGLNELLQLVASS